VLLWLHPQCQVLNHGSRLIDPKKHLWFLASEDSDEFRDFTTLLANLSIKVVGVEDCSPHVLRVVQENPGVEEAFARLNGVPPMAMLKDPMCSLVWKESQIMTNRLLHISINWDDLFTYNSKIRFLMPFRNPMDCAVSNHRQRKWIFFPGVDDNSPTLMLRVVLAEFAWFVALNRRYPDKFFYFYEDVTTETLEDLQTFLGLDYSQEWVDAVVALWKIRHPYIFSKSFADYCASMIRLHFVAWPEEGQRLVEYIDPNRVRQLRARDWARGG
jgi:hypothetical protein